MPQYFSQRLSSDPAYIDKVGVGPLRVSGYVDKHSPAPYAVSEVRGTEFRATFGHAFGLLSSIASNALVIVHGLSMRVSIRGILNLMWVWGLHSVRVESQIGASGVWITCGARI